MVRRVGSSASLPPSQELSSTPLAPPTLGTMSTRERDEVSEASLAVPVAASAKGVVERAAAREPSSVVSAKERLASAAGRSATKDRRAEQGNLRLEEQLQRMENRLEARLEVLAQQLQKVQDGISSSSSAASAASKTVKKHLAPEKFATSPPGAVGVVPAAPSSESPMSGQGATYPSEEGDVPLQDKWVSHRSFYKLGEVAKAEREEQLKTLRSRSGLAHPATSAVELNKPLVDASQEELEDMPVVSTTTTVDASWNKCDCSQGVLLAIVTYPGFDIMSLVVICLNTAMTFYTTDYQAAGPSHRTEPWMKTCEDIFVIYYSLEVGLKILALRCDFFRGPEWMWNIFDLGIVSSSLVEFLIMSGAGMAAFFDVTFMRFIRIFKIVRVLRMFRALRFFSELRIMMMCIVRSIMTLVWSCFFLVFILMVASLIFVQIVTSYRIDHPDGGHEDMEKWFGSVARAMLMLFQGSTGGIDWGDLHDELTKVGEVYAFLFLLYIIFFQFAFFNIVTSIFVEKAMKLAQPDEEEQVREKYEEVKRTMNSLRNLATRLDTDQDGLISLAELEDKLRDKEVKTLFEMHGLNIIEVKSFFKMLLILEGSKSLEIDPFVDGCIKARGSASSLDLLDVKNQIAIVSDTLAALANHFKVPAKKLRHSES